MSEYRLIDTEFTEQTVEDAIVDLFEEDGTVYLVTGFFTKRGFETIREPMASFLSRSTENEVHFVVGATIEQFSPAIARDIADLPDSDRVHLYKYTDGFLHPKLYVRTGDSPVVLVGSANLTRVAFRQNLELLTRYEGDDPDDPHVEQYVDWFDALLERCEPVTFWDLTPPVLVSATVKNWIAKASVDGPPGRFTAVTKHPVLVFVFLVILLSILS